MSAPSAAQAAGEAAGRAGQHANSQQVSEVTWLAQAAKTDTFLFHVLVVPVNGLLLVDDAHAMALEYASFLVRMVEDLESLVSVAAPSCVRCLFDLLTKQVEHIARELAGAACHFARKSSSGASGSARDQTVVQMMLRLLVAADVVVVSVFEEVEK